ncbi:hypothetical protein KZZ52_57060 [Dactylosporangium sp. AC04546]|uniref:hypothetical protein n=1 Tax=Dactylosporangium sp. AC04546 TaxID=2862460 RepID=UPI001EE08449|nr:hypothetical protein [Dactylosporangium sp. AC04546]WVK83321.1 hypothetical protein KZZ52_57060 [Dactylosporangium sp. AC04546]
MTYRSIFDEAISAEPGPPSSVDFQAIVARERRRRRRLVFGAGTVASGVIAAVTAAAVVGGGGKPATDVAAPPSVAPPSVIATTPTLTADQWNAREAARLTTVVEAKLRSLLPPGVTFLDSPVNGKATNPFEVVPYPPDDLPPDTYANGFIVGPNIRDAAGTGNVIVYIRRQLTATFKSGSPRPQTSCIPEFVPAGCHAETGPNGEILLITPRFHDENGSKIARIDVTKPDGTEITIDVRNWAEGSVEGQIGAPQRPQLPLTVEALVELALDPGMVIQA